MFPLGSSGQVGTVLSIIALGVLDLSPERVTVRKSGGSLGQPRMAWQVGAASRCFARAQGIHVWVPDLVLFVHSGWGSGHVR